MGLCHPKPSHNSPTQLSLQADLEMDLDQLEGAMKQAVRDLLAKYPRSEVEGLGWAAELDWLGDQPA